MAQAGDGLQKSECPDVPRVIDIAVLKVVGGWDKWKNGKMRWIEPNCMVVGMRVTST